MKDNSNLWFWMVLFIIFLFFICFGGRQVRGEERFSETWVIGFGTGHPSYDALVLTDKTTRQEYLVIFRGDAIGIERLCPDKLYTIEEQFDLIENLFLSPPKLEDKP